MNKKDILESLINAGYSIEVIRGYLNMKDIEKAKEHLSFLNRMLLKLAQRLNENS